MLYKNIAGQDHNFYFFIFFDASAASDSSVTSSSKSSDNPEPAPERIRRSRGGGSMRIEATAGESDDDGVFSNPGVLGVASIKSASATL